MREKYISTLGQYLSAIQELKSYYPTGMFVNNPVVDEFLYRGLCDEAYELLPGVFREHIQEIGDREIKNKSYLSWTKEKNLLMSFVQEASAYLSIPTDQLYKWAEYAQHYGVPTRFLDWSRNPLVALYFACRDKTDKDAVVWLLHQQNYVRFSMKGITAPNKAISEVINDLINEDSNFEYPLLYTPLYVDARMSAQSSYFMVWGKKEEALERMMSDDTLWMDLPEKDTGVRVFGQEQRVASLFKFKIHADRKQPLLHELDMVGINEKTLFPGLDGIGRYIERKHRFDYNEALTHV